MSAEDFSVVQEGKTADEAFAAAVDKALYDHGHSGYTGSIAEKNNFIMIDVPEGETPMEYADKMSRDNDARYCDKWGPACCIALGDDEYLFFGIASS